VNKIFKFSKFLKINDSYSFTKLIDQWPYIEYEFRNKDNINFIVKFMITEKGKYSREYHTKSPDFNKYDELNTNDPFNILKTVTDITISFINEYQPKEIFIEHIPTKKERNIINKSVENGNRVHKPITKRALINKRYLEKYLPKNYKYELHGSTSFIRIIE
jgi:hypothetical protein